MPPLTDAVGRTPKAGEDTWLSDVRLEFAKIVEALRSGADPSTIVQGSPVITRGEWLALLEAGRRTVTREIRNDRH